MIRQKSPKLQKKSKLPLIIMSVLFMVVGTYFLAQSFAGSNLIYISPASTTRYVGETFSVQVRISATNTVNAAFVNMTYNANGLLVTGIQRGADFPNQNAQTINTIDGNVGTIKMESTRNSSATGNFHYATITFKARTTGKYSLTPLATSKLIDYGGPVPFHSFTTAGGTFSFSNKPTTTPPVTPTPKPPVVSPTPTPPSTAPTTSIPARESAPSSSNLIISDFDITDIGYRSVTVNWKTNKPATSKVNYGPNSNDMPFEVLGEGKNTTHKLVIEGENIKAGNVYSLRVTSDDGNEPVTLDAEFSTKGVAIAVYVTDKDGLAVEGAAVNAGIDEQITNSDGQALFATSEGDILITATKDELYGELATQVNLPESEDSPPQEIEITIGDDFGITTEEPAEEGGGPSVIWIIFPILIVLGLVIFVIRRIRRNRDYDSTYGSLSSTSVTQTPATTPSPTPPPMPTPVIRQDTPDPSTVHHATLPELVSQGFAANRQTQASSTPSEPVTPAQPEPKPQPHPEPTPQPKPHSEPAKETENPHKTEHKKPTTHKKTASDEDQGVLRINHDKKK